MTIPKIYDKLINKFNHNYYLSFKKNLSLAGQFEGFANNALGVEAANTKEFMNKLTALIVSVVFFTNI